MTPAEAERFRTIQKRMAGRGCYCGHCDDLRFLLLLVGRDLIKEVVWAETEGEYRRNHPKEAAEIEEVEANA